MVRYPSPTLGSLPLPISLRSLSPILAATFMPPRGRPSGSFVVRFFLSKFETAGVPPWRLPPAAATMVADLELLSGRSRSWPLPKAPVAGASARYTRCRPVGHALLDDALVL